MADSHLENILKECTNRAKVSNEEKVFENLWKEQKERLNKHEKYMSESVEINPIPVFVCKARMREQNESIHSSKKVFLNICSHHLVPNLSVEEIDIHKNGQKEEGIRFPMSCGPKLETEDNQGNTAYTYDIVFHPDVIQYANDDSKYKLNICQTAVQNISQKENIIIEGPLKFPKCVYKGVNINHKTPLPQRIRKKGSAKIVQEQTQINNKMSNLSIQCHPNKQTKIKSDDVKDNYEGRQLKHDFYIIFVETDRKKLLFASVENLKEYLLTFENKENILTDIKGIQICVHITKKYTLDELDLNTNAKGIDLKFNQQRLFHFEWNNISNYISEFINCQQIIAKFIKKKCLLKIVCPFVQP